MPLHRAVAAFLESRVAGLVTFDVSEQAVAFIAAHRLDGAIFTTRHNHGAAANRMGRLSLSVHRCLSSPHPAAELGRSATMVRCMSGFLPLSPCRIGGSRRQFHMCILTAAPFRRAGSLSQPPLSSRQPRHTHPRIVPDHEVAEQGHCSKPALRLPVRPLLVSQNQLAFVHFLPAPVAEFRRYDSLFGLMRS